MKRQDLIKLVADALGVAPDYEGPTMVAVRAAIENPANLSPAAALEEFAEEVREMNRAYVAWSPEASYVEFDDVAPATKT